MKILITGGAGYIGPHVAHALHAAGHQSVVFDSLRSGRPDSVRWSTLVEGDIRDTAHLTATLKQHRVEAVIHMAALVAVGESVEQPVSYWDVNTLGTLSLARSVLEARVKHVVYSSTAAVYGIPRQKNIREDHPLAPVSPYAASKLAAERVLTDVATTGAFTFVPLRYFNASGASLDGTLGHYKLDPSHLIPRVCLAAMGKSDPLHVYGTDWNTEDGTCVRDYIHVADLADAHVRAVEYLAQGKEPRPFNLGTGNGHSVRSIIDTITAVSGRPVPHRDAPRRDGDMARSVADASAARRHLGWRPKHSDIHQLCRTTWDWMVKLHTS
jgi:UDP-glucose-4-epimerase GalE